MLPVKAQKNQHHYADPHKPVVEILPKGQPQFLTYMSPWFLVGNGGMDCGDSYWGLYRDYYRDPFPHSLLSARQKSLEYSTPIDPV